MISNLVVSRLVERLLGFVKEVQASLTPPELAYAPIKPLSAAAKHRLSMGL